MQNQAIRETEKQKLTAAHVGSYRKRHSKCTTLFRHAKAHRWNGAYFCVLSGYISGQEERLETDVNNAGYKTHTLKKKVAPKDKGFAVKSQQNHFCLQQKSHSVPGNNSEKRFTFTQRVAMVTRGKKSYLMFNQWHYCLCLTVHNFKKRKLNKQS